MLGKESFPEWARVAENDPEVQMLARRMRFKYTLDRILGGGFLVLASPLILLAVVLIKWDGWRRPEHAGPIFYTEPRISAGKIFWVVKFRTVPVKTIDWIRQEPESRSITGSGPRTWAGQIILNWYLDEVPQLVNIAKGEMTFVGLRPHILEQTREEVERGFSYRLKMKAGLFGVPQACKRDPKYQRILERMNRMHRPSATVLNTLDGLYVRKCKEFSPWRIFLFDLYITYRCFRVIFRGGGL